MKPWYWVPCGTILLILVSVHTLDILDKNLPDVFPEDDEKQIEKQLLDWKTIFRDEVEGPCTEKECKNEASCSRVNEVETCHCKQGYSGTLCEIGPCTEKECKNGATCSREDKEETCHCNQGFSGTLCEIGPCTDKECKNGATCSREDKEETCHCNQGFSGTLCEIVSDPCIPNPCKNDGTCENDKGNVKCKCKPPYTGGTCEEKDPCNPNPCKNDGTCVNDKGKAKCNCKSPYIGGTCEEKDPCSPNPCKNRGTCTNDKGTANCTCKAPYSGETCETGPCSENPCKNEGVCSVVEQKAKCKCKAPFGGELCENDTKCEEACGKGYETEMECTYEDVSKPATCTCTDSDKTFQETVKKCKETCDGDDCQNGGTCKGPDNGPKFCECPRKTGGDMCEIIQDCVKGGKFQNCESTGGKCSYNKDTKAVICTCNEDKKLDTNPGLNECRVPCFNDTSCKHKAKCEADPTVAANKFCKCKSGTSGDQCDTVDACQPDAIEKTCGTGTDVKCKYSEDKARAVCVCEEGKEFEDDTKFCRAKCSDDSKCTEANHQCKNKLCTCVDGYEGPDCSTVSGCKEGASTAKLCLKAGAKCLFDAESNEKARCECEDSNYEFDPVGECKPKFCKNNFCGNNANCLYDAEMKTGLCVCKDTKQYFDYEKKFCTALPDTCIVRKTLCGENRKCVAGSCKCLDNYKEENNTCIPDFCKKCFTGAKCDESGYFKCYCDKDTYFKEEKCEDAKCLQKNCASCPNNMQWNKDTNKCDIKDDYEACGKDCGYGHCIKKKKTEKAEAGSDTCVCYGSISDPKDETCVLKSTVCSPNERAKDLKTCNCTGKYKQADDGITCELITCADQSAKDECSAMGAECIMNWKKVGKVPAGYDCKCPKGYVMDEDKKICTSACDTDKAKLGCLKSGRICYNSIPDMNDETAECQCPPPLSYVNNACSGLATPDTIVTIRNIPVLKDRYIRNGKVDYVMLNAHLIQSMKQTFVQFDYGYLQNYKVESDVLSCTVWAQFKEKPAGEVERITNQTRSFECDECDTSLTVWPPNLLLKGPLLDKVTSEALDLCSSKDTLCGKEAECKDNKCYCPKGFKTVDYTLQKIGDKGKIQRCEDIDECSSGEHICSANTTCVNTPGDYYCMCNPGYKKMNDPLLSRDNNNKEDCYDLCTPNPCNKGSCSYTKDGGFDCNCDVGYEGSFCSKADVNYASAKKSTVVVGAILGTILGLTLIAFFLYYWKIKKNAYSEDFSPAPRNDHTAEMMERRPMRGMINKSYE